MRLAQEGFYDKRKSEVLIVSAGPDWKTGVRAECEAFVYGKSAVTLDAERDTARKNAAELRRAAQKERDAEAAANFRTGAAQADYYADCIQEKIAALPPLVVPPLSPHQREVLQDYYHRIYKILDSQPETPAERAILQPSEDRLRVIQTVPFTATPRIPAPGPLIQPTLIDVAMQQATEAVH